MKTLICAGMFRQAQDLARKQNLRMGEWIYIDSPTKLWGIAYGTPILMTGTYWTLPEYEEIEFTIRDRRLERKVVPL